MNIPQPGTSGPAVAELQKRLMALGYDLPKYGADGKWSQSATSETLLAVKAWQEDFHVDGTLDEREWHELTHTPALAVDPADFPPALIGEPALIARYGRPWEDVDAFWQKWGAPLELPHPLKRLTKRGRFWCNRDLVPILRAVFDQICDEGLSSHIKTYDGCFNVRKIRGTSTQWSIHSWGMAIDINAQTNAMGAEPTLHPRIVQIFLAYDFLWGGNFKRKDGMHFQRMKYR
jgi:hypothetical protein